MKAQHAKLIFLGFIIVIVLLFGIFVFGPISELFERIIKIIEGIGH